MYLDIFVFRSETRLWKQISCRNIDLGVTQQENPPRNLVLEQQKSVINTQEVSTLQGA